MTRGIEATWLWSGDPDDAGVAQGAVVVGEDDRVLAVGDAAALRGSHSDIRWERHEGVVIPGLVNARVSLELSALRGRIAGGRGYVPWLQELTAATERVEPDVEAIDAAISALVSSGTAAIGEVTSTGAAIERLAGMPLVARVFHEIAGLRSETAIVIRAMAEEHYESLALPSNVTLALAPHSLVGLHPRALAALFEGGGALPLPVPLARSAAERAFLADGGGPLATWMQERGADPADWEPPGLAPIAYAQALGVVGPAIIATHLTDAREPELEVLARLGAHVVLCPRAALHVEVKLPPLTALLAAGITPGLGTDSLAASPSLDVLEEALALHRRFPTVAPSVLCAMATSFGARALGLEHRLGRIAPGLAPGVLLVEGRTADPLAHVLAQAGRPRRVLVRPGSAL